MTSSPRKTSLFVAGTLAINALGVAAILGILFALLTGQDYHPFVIPAACVYLLLRPLLHWMKSIQS